MQRFSILCVVCLLAGVGPGRAYGADNPPTLDAVLAALAPYAGPSQEGVDRSTLHHKIMSGYQGWFTVPGDGAGLGWRHYSVRGPFKPGSCGIDVWPDVRELGDDEKFATPFRDRDGNQAQVFSSHNRKTVLRHFQWMKDYGLDGVFVQRFAVETRNPIELRHCNTVLAHCREGANRHGRCYAIMYDLTGLPAGGTAQVIEDWKRLVDRMKLSRDPRDPAYLKHAGKPVIAVWGIGFNDNRRYTLAECATLVDFLKNDKTYGGCTVMIGVPTGWRTLAADSVKDEALHAIIKQADIVSPWSVGRFRTLAEIDRFARERWREDLAWCRQEKKEYLPVVWPGFSWHNRTGNAPLNDIPRLKGRFLWKQFVAARGAGATMLYQAMFDEMDEATAIFKCTSTPPKGDFLTLDGLPSDHYLWLVGQGGLMLRGKLEASNEPPARAKN